MKKVYPDFNRRGFAPILLLLILGIPALLLLLYLKFKPVVPIYNTFIKTSPSPSTNITNKPSTESMLKDETANWKTWTNPGKKVYSFKYPDSWFEGELTGEGVESGGFLSARFSNYPYHKEFQTDSQNDSEPDYAQLFVGFSYIKNLQDESTQKISPGSNQTTSNGNGITKREDITVSGIPGNIYLSEQKEELFDGSERKVRVLGASFKKQVGDLEYVYSISVQNYPDQPLSAIEDILMKVISTFQFTE